MNVHESLQERAGLIIALQLIPHVIDALNGVLMLRLAQKFGRPEPTGKELPPWVPPLMDKKARLHAFNSAIGSRLFKILLWLKHSEGHVFMDIESPEEGPDPFRPRPAVLMGSKPPSSQGSVRVELSGLILALGSFFLLSPGSIQMAISLTRALILARVMRRTEHRFSVRPLAAA
jgi:hypothetical protein